MRTLTAILIFLLTTAQAAGADGDMTARIIERAKTMPLPLLHVDRLPRVYAVTFDVSKVPGAPISAITMAMKFPDGEDRLNEALDGVEGDLNRILENTREGRPYNQGVMPRASASSRPRGIRLPDDWWLNPIACSPPTIGGT
jgi:hypothetical protein